MATAYKYVERQAEDNINWSQVGKEFSDMLGNEANRREEKKAEIDKGTRDYLNTLEDVQLGESDELNTMTLNFAADLKETKLLQTTLLKSGQLKPREFNVMSQNLTDGTKQALDVFNVYSEEYSKKMAMNDPALPYGEQASDLQNFLMESVEGFSNFTETAFVADPRTGVVALAKLIDDPDNPNGPRIPDPNPNKLVSANNLTNRMRGTYRKYDVVTKTKEYSGTLGTAIIQEITSKGGSTSKGSITKLTTAMAQPGGIADMTPEEKAELAASLGIKVEDLAPLTKYQETQNKWIASQLDESVESTAAMSVLIDYVDVNPATGVDYYPTFDADAAAGDPNAVLVIQKGNQVVSQLTETQKNVAQRALATQMDMGLEYTEEVQAVKFYDSPQQWLDQKKTAKETREATINLFGLLYDGSAEQIDQAMNSLRSINEDITRIDRTDDGIRIYDANGNFNTVDFAGKSYEEFITAGVNFAIPKANKIDPDEVLKQTKGSGTRELTRFVTDEEGNSINLDEEGNSIYNKDGFTSRLKQTVEVPIDYTEEQIKAFNNMSPYEQERVVAKLKPGELKVVDVNPTVGGATDASPTEGMSAQEKIEYYKNLPQ